MRAEYCPSALLVDGCPVELSEGALEYFDEVASRYVLALPLISQKTYVTVYQIHQERQFRHLL